MALTSLELTRFEFSQMHMGVAVRITLFAPDRAKAERAGRAAFRRFAELDASLSDYIRTSALLRLCASAGQGPVKVGRDLFAVLQRAGEVAWATEGAFDVTAAPVVDLWREARRTGRMPEPVARVSALSLVGRHRMKLDGRQRTVSLDPGTRLDLGGIAKGYACDQALAALERAGVGRAMVEAGGDIAVSGPPPGRQGWAVQVLGLARPPFLLSGQALSTSGDASQFVEIGGERYSHIVDPRKGVGLTNGVQATVVAKTCFDSDPLTKAVCVTGQVDGPLFARYGAKAHLSG